MNIDFHMHGKLSKKVTFSIEHLLNTIGEAREEGLDATCLTEHFNTRNFDEIYNTLDAHYIYKSHYYEIDGFPVFPGMEVDIKEGGHVLVIGDRDDVRAVRKVLKGHEEKDQFIEAQALLDACKSYDLLKIVAHPYRDTHLLAHMPKVIFSQFDAIELNAKDVSRGGETMRDKVLALAEKMERPVVGGSDTHHYPQAGSIMNRLENECSSIMEIKAEIQKNTYEVVLSPRLKTKVTTAEKEKQAIMDAYLKRIS